jgi:hypothetical protein
MDVEEYKKFDSQRLQKWPTEPDTLRVSMSLQRNEPSKTVIIP